MQRQRVIACSSNMEVMLYRVSYRDGLTKARKTQLIPHRPGHSPSPSDLNEDHQCSPV
jgi:hypothetical protein